MIEGKTEWLYEVRKRGPHVKKDGRWGLVYEFGGVALYRTCVDYPEKEHPDPVEGEDVVMASCKLVELFASAYVRQEAGLSDRLAKDGKE